MESSPAPSPSPASTPPLRIRTRPAAVEVPALADLFAAHVPDSPPQWTSGAGDAPPCEVESIMDSAAWSALWSALAALGALAVTVIMALQYFAERGERGFV